MFGTMACARLVIALFVVAGCHDHRPPAAVANRATRTLPAHVVDPEAFVPFDVALVASPSAVRACMTEPTTCYQIQGKARRVLVGPGVVVLGWHGVVIYAAKDESSRAARFLESDAPSRFGAATFQALVGDLGMRHTTRSDLDLIGKDAGFTIDGPDGFLIDCFDCRAPSILGALAALGARITER